MLTPWQCQSFTPKYLTACACIAMTFCKPDIHDHKRMYPPVFTRTIGGHTFWYRHSCPAQEE